MGDVSQIKALTFDVFGTTVDWCRGIAREAKAMLAPKGYSLDWVKFANNWRREYQPAMEGVRSGKRGYVTMDVLHREMLDPVLVEFGVAGLTDDEKQHLALGWRRLDPWPDVVAGMVRLKKRFILAAVSNANIALAVEMAKRGGLPWDVILGAQIAQTYKPLPAVYDSAVSMLDLKPGNVMMVACHEWDLKAAATRGLRTAYVRRPDEYGTVAAPKPPAEGQFDIHVASFAELADRLGV
jgi:2-haloacid dehalogenase